MPARAGSIAPTNADVISTLLAGIAICLGALAIMIGGLAIWGYSAIKSEAMAIAKGAAVDAASEYMGQPSQQKELLKMLQSLIDKELSPLEDGMSMPSAFSLEQSKSDEPGSVGQSYPKEGGLSQ